MYTKGKETGLTKKFLEFMASKDVKVKVVNALKYIPTQDMKVKR
jgi:phosphate transport system substrate-binding protein